MLAHSLEEPPRRSPRRSPLDGVLGEAPRRSPWRSSLGIALGGAKLDIWLVTVIMMCHILIGCFEMFVMWQSFIGWLRICYEYDVSAFDWLFRNVIWCGRVWLDDLKIVTQHFNLIGWEFRSYLLHVDFESVVAQILKCKEVFWLIIWTVLE